MPIKRQLSGTVGGEEYAPGPWRDPTQDPRLPNGQSYPYDLLVVSAHQANYVELGKVVAIPAYYPPIDAEYRGREYWYWSTGPAWPDAFRVAGTADRTLPTQAYQSYTNSSFGDPDPDASITGTCYVIEDAEGTVLGYLDKRSEGLAWFADPNHLSPSRHLDPGEGHLVFRVVEDYPADVSGHAHIWTPDAGGSA